MRAWLLGGLLIGTLTPAAVAQPALEACFSANAATALDLRIDSCTSAIESGRLPPETLAIALQNRATAYAATGDVDRAILDYDEAIKVDPTYANAFNGRGVAYEAKGDKDKAIADYGKAIMLDPANANALNGRCWLRAAMGQLEAALADCNESLKVRPNNSNTLDSRALVHILAGRWDDALADSDAALRANPRNAYALFERGLAKLRKGDTAGGNTDIAASRALDSNVETEFAGLGVRL